MHVHVCMYVCSWYKVVNQQQQQQQPSKYIHTVKPITLLCSSSISSLFIYLFIYLFDNSTRMLSLCLLLFWAAAAAAAGGGSGRGGRGLCCF